MGFGTLLEFALDAILGRLAYIILTNFHEDIMEPRFNEKRIKISRETVRNVFGIPMGKTKLEDIEINAHKVCDVKEFYRVYKKHVFTTSDLVHMIIDKKVTGCVFRMSFLMLFSNTLCFTNKSGSLDSTILLKINEETVISGINWCSYMLLSLVCKKDACVRGDTFVNYAGPLMLLVLAYCDRFSFGGFDVKISWPVCNN